MPTRFLLRCLESEGWMGWAPLAPAVLGVAGLFVVAALAVFAPLEVAAAAWCGALGGWLLGNVGMWIELRVRDDLEQRDATTEVGK